MTNMHAILLKLRSLESGVEFEQPGVTRLYALQTVTALLVFSAYLFFMFCFQKNEGAFLHFLFFTHTSGIPLFVCPVQQRLPKGELIDVDSPFKMPNADKRIGTQEPFVRLEMLTPQARKHAHEALSPL